MPEKHWIKSKTIQWSMVSLISFIVVFFMSKTAADKYFAISGIISSIGSIYSRFVAKHKLVLKEKKDG